MGSLPALGLSCISGLILAGAFPSIKLGYFAFAGLLPLFTILRNYTTGKVLLWVWVSGLVFHGITLFWMRNITWAGMLIAIPILAFFFALPFAVSRIIYEVSPRLGFVVLPFAVAGTEWMRSFDGLAFPWMILGNSQSSYPFFVQFADITSVYGVSAWIVLVNISLYLLVRKKTLGRWLLLTALFVLPTTYSLFVIHTNCPGGEELKVALVQGNVLPEEKWKNNLEFWNVKLYCTMSIEAMAHEPDIIVWPETATPVYLLQTPHYRHMVQSLVDSIGVPVLTGMPSSDSKTEKSWNSAGYFVPGQYDVMEYKKIHLVPIGEAIPLDNYFPSLRKLEFGQANWDEGSEAVVFTSAYVPPFCTVICFESIFPDLVRRFVKKGVEFLVVITNDVWFGPGTSPEQHAMIAVFRAIEFHRPLIRCANTGISMIIDPFGRILKQTGTFKRETLIGSITPTTRKTFYLRFGNVFSVMSILFTTGCLIGCIFFRSMIGRGSE